MKYKKVTITLPQEVLSDLDEAADSSYLSRSAYIREAITLKRHLELSLEHESYDRDSFTNVVKQLHFVRKSRITLRKQGLLTWNQSQD